MLIERPWSGCLASGSGSLHESEWQEFPQTQMINVVLSARSIASALAKARSRMTEVFSKTVTRYRKGKNRFCRTGTHQPITRFEGWKDQINGNVPLDCSKRPFIRNG